MSGSCVVVGAFTDGPTSQQAGSAFVFHLASASPTSPVATLNNPTPANGDWFGWSVSIDGTTVAVGTPFDDTVERDEGAAYVFGPLTNSPLEEWKWRQLGDPFAPDLGDADSDGLGNLGEYGLLHLPTTPEGAPFSAASAFYPEGERLRLFVPRDPARNDITIEVQATGDLLGSWTTIATSTLGAPFSGPGYFGGDSATPGVKSVEVRDTVNVTDAPQRFLRLRVRH
jgi:hypothetical protein